MDVKEKVVIVTGASSGIGEATARLLAKQGARVILAARTKDKLEKLVGELPNSFAVPTDVTIDSDLESLVSKTLKKFGKIDILVNNAGRGYDTTFENINIDNFRKLIELDLVAYVSLMKKVIPHMKKQKAGAIINISSGTAVMSIPGLGAYSSLKRAIVGVSLTAREELEKYGIVVSVMYPFITKTNFYKNVLGGTRENIMPEERNIPEADTSEYVAEKILKTIKTGVAETFAHDFMDPKRK